MTACGGSSEATGTHVGLVGTLAAQRVQISAGRGLCGNLAEDGTQGAVCLPAVTSALRGHSCFLRGHCWAKQARGPSREPQEGRCQLPRNGDTGAENVAAVTTHTWPEPRPDPVPRDPKLRLSGAAGDACLPVGSRRQGRGDMGTAAGGGDDGDDDRCPPRSDIIACPRESATRSE